MKMRCVKDDLLKGIQVVQKGVSTKSTLPVLSSILFQAENDLKLHTTDLETFVSCSVEGKIIKKGSVGVPARLIGDIVRSLPDAAIDISYDTEKREINLVCENSFFDIKTLPAEDFPKIVTLEKKAPASTNVGEYMVENSLFLNIIKQVIRAASRDETRPILTGVLLTVNRDKVKMVATDSYRLAVREGKLEKEEKKQDKKEKEETKEEEEKIRVVVPTKALEDVMKISSILENSEVKIGLLRNHIVFDLGKAQLISRLIEGQYPNYQQLLPENYQVELPIKREELVGAVKRISLLAQNNSPVRLNLGKNNLSISAATQEVGEAKEDLKISYEGEEIKVAFNGQYLLDGLTAANQEEILIKLLGPLKPGLIKPVGNDEFLYLIMPVRLG